MYTAQLSDDVFEKLTYLIIKFNTSISTHISYYNCFSKIHVLPVFHKVFEKEISKKQVKELTDRPLKNKIFNTYHNRLIYLLMMEACVRNMPITEYLKCIGYINYVVLFKKYIPYCNDNILSQAILKLKTTHNFRKFASPKDVIDKLCTNLEMKYYNAGICSQETIEVLLIHVRTRLARSLKSLTTRYLQYAKESKTDKAQIDVDRISDMIATKISSIGYVPKIKECESIYYKIEQIRKLEYNELFIIAKEIITVLGTNPSRKKINGQLHNLISVQNLMQKLDIPITKKSIACVVYTIIQSGGFE